VANNKQVEAVAYFKILPNSPGDPEDFLSLFNEDVSSTYA